MTDTGTPRVSYDTGSDVLYIVIRKEAATRGVEDGNGIVWRYGADNSLIGVTIQDFHDMWDGHITLLADEISRRSDLTFDLAKAAIEAGSHTR
jgi:uncharacterized protein YuzE